MRKLVWFTVGFTAGIGAFVWVLPESWSLWVSGILLFSSLVFGFFLSPGLIRRRAAFAMAGCAVGICWIFVYSYVQLSPARVCDGQVMELEIQSTDYSYATSSGICGDGVIALEGRRCKVRFYLNDSLLLTPGDRIQGSFFIRYTGSGAIKSPTYHRGEGILLLAYSEDTPYIHHSDTIPARYFAAQLRQRLYTMLERLFPADTAGFARALLLGDSSGLLEKEDNAFQNSGIRHIIAVSGLHVSILFSFVYISVGKRGWLTAIIGFPVLFLFAALAGFTPSVIRACIMQGMMILSMVLRKQYDPTTALAFAVLVILGINPLALTGVGFQLSVGCVLGILLFSGRIHRYIISRPWMGKVTGKSLPARLKRFAARSISASLGAITLTVPCSAYYFGAVSTLSVVTNLLCLWAVTVIFCGILLSCVVGFIYVPAGSVIAWIVSWLMRYVQLIANLISKLPYSMVSSENSYIVAWLIICYALMLCMLHFQYKRPLFCIGCAVITLCAALSLSWLERHQEHFRMTVLDVGQGQCILLQTPEGCYMVDCGGDSGDKAADQAVHTLRTQGIHKLDGLILTHFDRDHAGGALSLLSQIPVEAVYLPDADPQEQLRIDLESQCEDRICWVRHSTYMSCGEADISIYPGKISDSGNNSSLSILFQVENCDILITGDLSIIGEQALLEQVRLPKLEIMVAGHHGAENSSSFQLLHALRPAAVVISVGIDNNYGHPSQKTLARFEFFGCRVWRTDQNGTVVFRG